MGQVIRLTLEVIACFAVGEVIMWFAVYGIIKLGFQLYEALGDAIFEVVERYLWAWREERKERHETDRIQ